jgi:hypothetical protein
MQLIVRDKCVVSGTPDLEPLYNFHNFPVFMGCIDQPLHNDLKQDMSWCISRNSGLIQLKKLLPLDVLYPESHGSGAVGTIWENHHTAFANFINKTTPSSVLEIGGGHGILETKYRLIAPIPWTILEPNPAPVEGCQARFLKGFFDKTFTYSDEFDTVVHSHVFEHIYNPDHFMEHLSDFMSSGQKLIFSLPNMQTMLEKNYTNCLNFEHTVFLTEPYVEHLLARHGFMLLFKEYFKDDHSIFYSVVRDSEVKEVPLSKMLYEKNKTLFNKYVQHHDELVADLNLKMRNIHRPIYLFGAHVFAQHLIAMGLNTDQIICVLDNDSKKQGGRLYGTNLNVASPIILSSISNPVVILKAGIYNEEIKTNILNINKDTEFFD